MARLSLKNLKSFARKKPRLIAAAAVGALALSAGLYAWRLRGRGVSLDTPKPSYLHYEMVEIRLKTRDAALRERWRAAPPVAVVKRDGKVVTTIAGVTELPLRELDGAWIGRWPVPWNAAPGAYELALTSASAAGFEDRVRARSFSIARRAPKPMPPGFAALTLETVMPLESMKVVGPDGVTTDWRGILDWAQYIGVDAFWMLGGQTPGKNPGEVWVTLNEAMIPKVAQECRKRGLKFGVYAMCYLTMSKEQVGGYEYAQEIEHGQPVVTRAISLRDPKRPRDVAARLKAWRDTPGVDYVGLDYIRNALGGYELTDAFFSEMPGLHPPADWARLTTEQRMAWFARKKVARRDMALIDAWQWWRAHRVGGIVRQIKDELGDEKGLWAFTLTWDKGWHHGQDPVMMNDAGVDMDALMLYEATKEQYDALIKDWRAYVKGGDVQLVVGDVIDWPLHQRDPSGPEEFYRRTIKASEQIYGDGARPGIFFHDASRALWGRVGPWGTRAWMDQCRRAVKKLKSEAAVAVSTSLVKAAP